MLARNTEHINMDTQQVEILGTSILKSFLIAGDVEVAKPERDNGIDLIAFICRDLNSFNAIPIQLKSASNKCFSIDRKYQNIPNLWMAYTWNAVNPEKAEVYLMKYALAISIGEKMGYTNTPTWINTGKYSTTSPSVRLTDFISEHRVAPSTVKQTLFENQ